jgi:ABC-2 type transport system permease protein
MNLKRTIAVARKEGLHILRDPRSLLMALAIPALMLLLFGYALTLDVDRVPAVIYDHDRSPESRELVARFAGSRYFRVLGSVSGYRTIERLVDQDRCLIAVVIPRDYARTLGGGGAAEVQLIVDGSNSNTASIAMGYAEGLVRAYSFELRSRAMTRKAGAALRPPVDAQVRVWYNQTVQSKNYVVPGLIGVILAIIAAMLTSLTIAREWENGTMEQLISTPVRAQEIVLGKMAAYFVLGVVDTVTALAVGVLLFQVPLRGNPLLMLVSACVFMLGALFTGIFVSAVARTQLQAYQVGLVVSFLPAFLLSGFVFAIENMPAVIQALTYLFPARYFVTLARAIFMKGVGLEVIWAELLLLAGYAALLFVATSKKLRAKVA